MTNTIVTIIIIIAIIFITIIIVVVVVVVVIIIHSLVVQRLIEFSINRDYDCSVWLTILCFHVSILVQLLHTFSRVPLVSY